MPIAPEMMITAMPMPTAAPPMLTRKAAVMAMATRVGTVPKYSPETPIRIERVSKTIPCSSFQDASMTITPTMPMMTPDRHLAQRGPPDPPVDGEQVVDERQGQQQRGVEYQLQEKGLVHMFAIKFWPESFILLSPLR